MTYPPDWPKCFFCDQPALDGHLTCGAIGCPEAQARAIRDASERLTPIAAPPRAVFISTPGAAEPSPAWMRCRSLSELDD
ncbi:hypothetical protein [Bradyrhizobium tunisiense]|uniref:hypothetical protein n=1 Tax=Bradyrhizobium tunisiense TaxID=3278709 RepID=UPI0035D5C376